MNLIEKPAKFFSDVNHEMSKVSWPTYDDLRESTIIVIILSLLLVVFIFGTDWILTQLIKSIF